MTSLERINEMCRSGVYANTPETAYPQTVVADIMRAHLEVESEKKKRILVWGLDGVRADCVPSTLGDGAVSYLKELGGVHLTYAGGDPKRPETLQKTCTWQGWAAIQTGKWGIENGVVEFTTLNRNCPTVMLEAARRGLRCMFSVGWQDHLTVTYKDEIEMAHDERLDFRHVFSNTDEKIAETVIDAVNDGTDIIFCILEGPDHAGHSTGFSKENPNYTEAISRDDGYALDAIRYIENRLEYSWEDWLIIITTDHGGHDRTHFDQSADDKMTFITLNKKML